MGTILLTGAGLQATVTGPTYDPDAQLFFNAQSGAGVILTTTQMNAINQWVIDSKAAGIWTKMKAIYPMVGGTATSHKFNLKNPLDTDAAFRLVFNGGWTHSANGVLPNGTNAYADTFFNPSAITNNNHMSIYIRTNIDEAKEDIGIFSAPNYAFGIESRVANVAYYLNHSSGGGIFLSFANTDSRGFHINTRNSSSNQKGYLNGILKGTNTVVGTAPISLNIYIGCRNNGGVATLYSSKEFAFASIGDGLTDLESQLFYQITEKYQVALSRNVNTTQSFYYNSAYNNETNAFLFSTQITDNTIQTATDTLVTDLKAASIWTKMKAVYPIVGGTATTHKFNLVDAQDTNAAFRLVFAGGVTHSSNGFAGNGTNGWANTFLNPNTLFPGGFASIGVYNKQLAATGFILSTQVGSINYIRIQPQFGVAIRHYNRGTANTYHTVATDLGFSASSRTSNALMTSIDNSGALQTITTNVTIAYSGFNMPLLVNNSSGAYSGYSNAQLSFAYISDALTSGELTTLKSINDTFQTTLGRQV